jgi:hypothetical protein
MRTRFNLTSMAVVFGVAALLLFQPGKAQAHPQLAGRWFATTPANVNMSFEFFPGEYLGDDIWRGTYILYWANCQIASGGYELRVFRGTTATLGLQDGRLANARVAVVDLGTRVMTLKDVTYRP